MTGVHRGSSKAVFWLLFMLVWAGPVPLARAAADARSEAGRPQLSFGIVPQQSATRLAQLWTPFLRYLGDKAGCTLHFRTARDIPTFEQRLARGDYDFAYMNPYHYTVFSAKPGYRAFAREKGAGLQGIIVVRRDSRFRRIEELDGLKVAFPAPASFAASIVPHAYMRRAGLRIVPGFVASHDSVYAVVAKGIYPAGGGVMRTYGTLDPELAGQLRVLWTTPAYTPHPFAAHPRVPQAVLARLRAAMLAMHLDPEGRHLLHAIRFREIAAAHDGDYDDTRKLGVTPLVAAGRNH